MEGRPSALVSGFVVQPRACGLGHLASLTVRIFWKMCEHTLVGLENVGASSFIPTISQRYFMDVILVQSDARTGYIKWDIDESFREK